MNLLVPNTQPTMTSREIAELVESRHDKVKQSIERLANRGAIGVPSLGEYLDSMGRPAKEYRICKRDSYVIVAQLSPEFTARLVDRWQELEAKQAVQVLPDFTNPAEAARAWADQFEQRRRLEDRVAADAPKVEFAEAVRALDGVCSVEQIAKTLGYGRNKFFKALKADGILMENRLPYQKYIDRCYFAVIENAPYTDKEGKTHPTFTTRVTGAGQVFLQRKYGRRADDLG